MTILLLGEGCPGVIVWPSRKKDDEESEEIEILAFMIMAGYEPDRKPKNDN